MVVDENSVIEKADEIISKNSHNLDSACKLNSMADSLTSRQISEMKFQMQAMKTVQLRRVPERIKVVYVFDTIYVPVFDHADGLSKAYTLPFPK